MGCDIHWVIERQHQDGAWEAVLSKIDILEIVIAGMENKNHRIRENMAGQLMAQRDYHWFGLISDIRHDELPGLGVLARQGLPDDISPTTANVVGYEDHDLHTQGWYTLGDLEAWPVLIETEGRKRRDDRFSDALEAVRFYTEDLRAILLEHDVHTIMPETDTESSHERVARRHRERGLLPARPDTVRVVIAYDS